MEVVTYGEMPRKTIATSIMDLVGSTPIVYLKQFSALMELRVFAKLEYLNPCGSIKDRSARQMIRAGIEAGAINTDTVIIESSSGNLGIALAQFCKCLGLRFVCVVDVNASVAKVEKIRALGGEIRCVDHPDPLTKEFLPARIALVQQLLAAEPNSYWPNQYANLHNAEAHHQTMREIASSIGADVDYLFVAVSSCGTLRGCADFLRARDSKTKLIAVDAEASHIFGSASGTKRIPGLGAGLRPALLDVQRVAEAIKMSDLDCIRGCRQILNLEGIFVGGSSGAIVNAIEKLACRIPSGSTCVAVLPDGGDHYLDTVYNDDWVEKTFQAKTERS